MASTGEPKKLFKYYLDENIAIRDNRPLFFRRNMRYNTLISLQSILDGELTQRSMDIRSPRRDTCVVTSSTVFSPTSHGTTSRLRSPPPTMEATTAITITATTLIMATLTTTVLLLPTTIATDTKRQSHITDDE